MSFPPFPAHDLAKLVLGYLVEEQLMTAYDEFLQASPYLDAFTNEYDRLSMLSLRNILSEYRSMRLLVETCKPSVLRRKLLQCPNLMEMLRFLISNVDMGKIYDEDMFSAPKLRSASRRSKGHDINRYDKTLYDSEQTICHNSSQPSEMETTLLADLPGNIDNTQENFVRTGERNILEAEDQLALNQVPDNYGKCTQTHTPGYNYNYPVSIEEVRPVSTVNTYSSTNNSKRSVASTFQDFSTSVEEDINTTIPDSSTLGSSTINLLHETKVSDAKICSPNANITIPAPSTKIVRKTQYLLQISSARNNSYQTNDVVNQNNNSIDSDSSNTSQRAKSDDQKIKILSDVKVDHKLLRKDLNKLNKDNSNDKIPPLLKETTFNPLLRMQTIYVNGAAAYKSEPKHSRKFTFTKDEIMAMPTIILLPTTGTPQITTNSPNTETVQERKSSSTEPLSIDVHMDNQSVDKEQDFDAKNKSNGFTKSISNSNNFLLKTADIVKNQSLPKDTHSVIEKTMTPQESRPLRKSSSTPRRSTHVRVLDFNTPRRILHETISENAIDSNSAEFVLSKTTKLPHLDIDESMESRETEKKVKGNVSRGTTDEKVCKENKKCNYKFARNDSNWDSNLRALAITNDQQEVISTPKSSLKKKKLREKKPREKKTDVDTKNCDKKKPKIMRKPKNKSSNPNSTDVKNDDSAKASTEAKIPIKPTINLITEWKNISSHDDKTNKLNIDTQDDTPEMERNTLQNAIEAKLNLSDFLETPYKQAMYDIAMDTPRFLGPDVPDEPVSDIKIMNIPTPRFLSTGRIAVTPKPPQPTPSSYSSRPTDYSSGGSYYKPDEQDYVPSSEDFALSEVSSPTYQTNTVSSEQLESKMDVKKSNTPKKSARPVRQCTKNVSYYRNPVPNKTKVSKEKRENNGSSSDSDDNAGQDDNVDCGLDTNKEDIPIKRTKSEPTDRKKKAKSINSKRESVKKSTPKEQTKCKIKRFTPTKVSVKHKTKSDATVNSITKSQNRKRSNSKDKYVSTTSPAIAPAPTKSRRKSSTPRKLHYTKTLHIESSRNDCPEIIISNKDKDKENHRRVNTEGKPLIWPDNNEHSSIKTHESSNEVENISKIKAFIQEAFIHKADPTVLNRLHVVTDDNGSLHMDLVKRGFDLETARIIERDLSDSPPLTNKGVHISKNTLVTKNIKKPVSQNKETIESLDENKIKNNNESNNSTNNLRIEENENEDNLEFSVCNCDESCENYIEMKHEEVATVNQEVVMLKDNFCMEVCIEDVTIRLRTTPFTMLIDEVLENSELKMSDDTVTKDIVVVDVDETEAAVKSILNIEKLYTPRKELSPLEQAKCLEIFDSTLTSLDTPLKDTNWKSDVTQVVLEVEPAEDKTGQDISKKRKRLKSGSVSDEPSGESSSKKSKTQYIPNIQNFDIESVLSKLHGP